ncbi:hypothetical protein [Priestia flexa]|uniref:hypothetical protein n=1 Tax=Priestia flexa TaxID=86664 RepID=UPI0004740227|nr:hypothetical protein [Priestia flexa]
MKLIDEKTFGYHLGLEAAVCHYVDYLCGDFDQCVMDENEKYDWENDSYESMLIFENGRKIKVEVCATHSQYREEVEWFCKAYEA